ncbi:MAG: transposase [Candidatus Eremiobacteraeota bacterium]|nr:transposase [Candidatus Eremiobacteraeota bacterium]
MLPNPNILDPEVPAKATRRRFTAVDKARILDEYESASSIERAAICRREHIYSSHIANWRKQRAAGAPLEAKRGRKPDPDAAESTRLRKENEKLQQRLAKAERIIDIQGKAYALLRAVAGESADQMDLPPWQNKP